MSDSSSFSSLLALVDSHLSKCSLQTNETPGMSKSIPTSSLNGIHKGLSEAHLASPSKIPPLPPFNTSDSPINNILAEQVSNMLKAKAKIEEEAIKLDNGFNKSSVEEDDDFIDLMKAIQEPKYNYVPVTTNESRESSPDFPFLYGEEFELDSESENENKDKVSTEWLPCNTDMSYILKQKVRRGKCSPFGKVLTARLRPVAAPYLKEKVESTIKRFDFSIRSPCDCIAEKLRRPTTYSLPNYVRLGIFDVDPIVTSTKNFEDILFHNL